MKQPQYTPRRAFVLLPLAVLIFCFIPVSKSEASIIMGETSILTVADSGNANLLLAQSATLSQTATIQSLSFYVRTTGGGLRLGVYDATGPSGGPGALKAETDPFTPVSIGWNTANVITPVSLSAGTYWIAYLPESSSLGFWYQASPQIGKYYAYAYGAMPTTFSTSPITVGHWSFYATLELPSVSTAPTRIMRLFEGFKIKFISGRVIIQQKQ